MHEPLTPDDARSLLDDAKEAADRGDPFGMLEAIFESRFADGLLGRLQKKWGDRIPREDLRECVAEAIDEAYAAVQASKAVRDIGAWLWKVADNRAKSRWNEEYKNREEAVQSFDDLASDEGVTAREREGQRELEERRRSEALRVAKELLPQIGTGRIVDVMALVIEAAEGGVADLPARTVADTLGISEGAARTLVSRGLQRLRREAERAGVCMPEITENEECDEVDE